MQIIHSVKEMINLRNSEIFSNKSIGFVPTMGSLHDGHLDLVKRAKQQSDFCVVSIFVNPKQFNNKSDFEKYPKKTEEDIEKLKNVNCDFVFIPENNDIYNNYSGFKMDFGGLDKIYEGKYRPGHFQGVVDIVYRLFDIIKPHKAFFGQKDYQQVLVIKKMTDIAGLNTEIIECPTVREKSGLAMSSRNERLSQENKKNASEIFQIVSNLKFNEIRHKTPDTVAKEIQSKIDSVDNLKTEYIAFCEPNTLNPVKIFNEGKNVIVCLAVFCEEVRLIDNIFLHF